MIFNYGDADNNDYACRNNDWLYIKGFHNVQWLLTPYSPFSDQVLSVDAVGYVDISGGVYDARGVRPVFYLDSELVTESGEGTSGSPYVLV